MPVPTYSKRREDTKPIKIEMKSSELWRTIADYGGLYEVSSLGRVRSLASGQFLEPVLDRSGYAIVALARPKKRWAWTVHSLVAQAFLGEQPAGTVIHHRDFHKQNNAAVNLVYLSRAQVMRLGWETGQFVVGHGEKGSNSLLINQEVAEIRQLAKEGLNPKQLATRFHVGLATVYDILRGRTWVGAA